MINIKNIFDKHNFATHLVDKSPFSNLNTLGYFKEMTVFNRELSRTHEVPDDFKKYNSVEIMGKGFKGIIPIADNYFHFFSDFIGPIILFLDQCVKNDIKSVHLILTSQGKLNIVQNFDTFLDYCIGAYSKDISVSYEIVDFDQSRYIQTENVAMIRQADIGETIYEMYKLAVGFAELDRTIKPSKKVFLIRSLDKSRDASFNRTVNENECKEFFENLGFEIISAEKFGSLKEQMTFFNEVSVFAGFTGAGLTSSMFMQPGQTVVEIVSPMRFGDSIDKYELHNFYKTISMLKNHRLLNVSNINKQSDKLLEDLAIISKSF